jgi:hypothetical protein
VAVKAGHGSVFADAAAARRALALMQPTLEAAIADRSVCGSGFLCIVVMDPALSPHEAAFDEAVLVEHSVGPRADWDADYAAFARAKAQLAWREACDCSAVSAHRLRAGDCLLAGAIVLDGIVVAVSGAHAEFDEALALAVAAQLRAVATQRRQQALRDGAWQAGAPG